MLASTLLMETGEHAPGPEPLNTGPWNGSSIWMEKANRELFIGAIIERVQGIENLEEILSVKGISAIFLGPFELAIELGIKPPRKKEGRGTLSVLRDAVMDRHMEYLTAVQISQEPPGSLLCLQGVLDGFGLLARLGLPICCPS